MIKEYVIGGREGGIDWCSLTSSITDKVPLTTTPNATLSNATSGENQTPKHNTIQERKVRFGQIGLKVGGYSYINKGVIGLALDLGLGDICIDEDQGGHLQKAWLLHLLCRALVRWSMERHLLLATCADDPPISPTRGYMSQSEID